MTSHLVVIELRAVEFVVPDEIPGLALGGGRQGIFHFGLLPKRRLNHQEDNCRSK